MLGGDGRKKNGGARAGAGRKAGLPNSSTLEFRNYVRQYTKEAVDMFVAAMRDEKMDMRFRLEAANWLVERGYGKRPHNLRTTDRSRKSFALSKGRDNHIIVIVLVVWSSYAASMMHGAARAMGFQNAPRSSSQNLLICARYAPLWPG